MLINLSLRPGQRTVGLDGVCLCYRVVVPVLVRLDVPPDGGSGGGRDAEGSDGADNEGVLLHVVRVGVGLARSHRIKQSQPGGSSGPGHVGHVQTGVVPEVGVVERSDGVPHGAQLRLAHRHRVGCEGGRPAAVGRRAGGPGMKTCRGGTRPLLDGLHLLDGFTRAGFSFV